ncbi:MAG: beta-ketoacyl-ACP synthase II [Candidatus Fimadaptatus sp.]|jgi:3-oxoacyl-[acyl-carrier-protein] synthase II
MRVVITGMGVISPIGNDIPAFRDSLYAGRCGIGPITRFDTTDYKCKVAGEVRDFDITNYGMEKGDGRRMDLYSQYAMAAAYQAVTQSGIMGSIDPEQLGVYVGSGIGGFHTSFTEAEKLLKRGPSRVSPLYIPMMIANIATGNIAIKFNAQGPSLPVVTACATSTNAVGEAYRAIKDGYATAIIAGGAEAAIEPMGVAGFCNCKALCETDDPTVASLPFDKRRSGFTMGEGAGILVLEELEHARARGANILCEVVGYGNTCDAHHITAPDPEGKGAARAIRQAVEQMGGIDGQLYINAHGTGTPLNDRTETLAIKMALGEDEARRAVISSTKSMHGHMLGATGAVELCACVLALNDGIVPPTINLNEPDPDCDLDYTPNAARKMQLDCAISTSLGFGGHNAVVALRRFK